MIDAQSVLELMQKYLPGISMKEVKPILAEIEKSQPDITLPQLEQELQKNAAAEGGQAPAPIADKEAKLAALQGMGK